MQDEQGTYAERQHADEVRTQTGLEESQGVRVSG